MPLYVKGGAWTNVEDEILKAAVSKYGLNQWARVSSLLTKKSAKQAKARWNEWLSPTINKNAWTREDDDKLLLLAKIMPNQWQSIAPIMGRTAASCSDRYNELIDGLVEVAQAGDVNLNAELQPARPDEADDEEMELLAEAKARLANTQGKKAQRKARERMLRETLRLSQLQKRHELNQAGVSVKLRYSEAELNHIPHERVPQAGLYDTSSEKAANEVDLAKFDNRVAKTGVDQNKKRKKDTEEQKEDTKHEVAVAAEEISTLEAVQLKKRKLNLPAPGTDADAETIDDRIHESVAQIKSRMAETSALAAATTDAVSSGASGASSGSGARSEAAAKQAKKFRKTVMEYLSLLPPPVNRPKVVLPSFEAEQEQIPIAENSNDDGERIRMLETLRLVDEEKAKLRRSQAIQKDLPIPHPSLIRQLHLDALPALILDELRQLVASDYKKYVDPRYNATTVADLDEDIHERIHSQVDSEVLLDLHPKVPALKPLGLFSEELTNVHSDIRTEIESLKLVLTAKYAQEEEAAQKIKQSIVAAAEEYAQQNSDIACYSQILDQEKVAIEARSARLHELVDAIVHEEHRLADHLKAS